MSGNYQSGSLLLTVTVAMGTGVIISTVSKGTAVVKILGILGFAGAALWAAGWSFEPATGGVIDDTSATGFLAGVTFAILAYKGVTTIANSGDEVVDSHKNVGRAIMISLSICVVVYMLVTSACRAAFRNTRWCIRSCWLPFLRRSST